MLNLQVHHVTLEDVLIRNSSKLSLHSITIFMMHVGFFVANIVAMGDWQVVLKKEPRSKHVVVEVEKLLLRVDVGGEKDGLGVELGYRHNVGQKYNEEGAEEVFTEEVEYLDAKLHQNRIDNDSDVEGEN